MFIKIKIIFVIFLFLPSLNAKNISVMSINAQNLFDTIDDPNKDDKAFLPIELKQSQSHKEECNNITVKRWRTECFFQDWNEETKNAKLNNLVTVIISYGNNGADVVGLQEIENINILGQLFQLLKPFGYTDFKLLESSDKRGVDTAFISRYKIKNPKLHYVSFSPSFETIDTRPIFEVDIEVEPNKVIKFYNVHFPSNWHPVQMRIESFGRLNDLINSHNQPAIALGDFNLNTKDDLKFNIYKDQEDLWYVAHREGCALCKGTYYYGKGATWDFLDTIMVSRDRDIEFDVKSIDVFKTEFNTYKDTGKPRWFNSKTKLGTSDHFPIVALINID